MKNRKLFSAILLAAIGLTGLTLGVLSLFGVWDDGVILLVPLGFLSALISLTQIFDGEKHRRARALIGFLCGLCGALLIGMVVYLI